MIEQIIKDIERNANRIAGAAQSVYDDWDQVDGYSEEYGYTWRKIEGVRLSGRDVYVEDYSDYYDELI